MIDHLPPLLDFNLKQTFGLAVIDAENWALIKISLSPAGFTTLMSWPMSSYSTPVPASTTYCPIGHTFFIPLAEDSSYTGPFQLVRSRLQVPRSHLPVPHQRDL